MIKTGSMRKEFIHSVDKANLKLVIYFKNVSVVLIIHYIPINVLYCQFRDMRFLSFYDFFGTVI